LLKCSALRKKGKRYPFTPTRNSLTEVLTDHKLASLGDAFVNLAYSLALSNRKDEPFGKKVKGSLLAEGLRKAGLRKHVPSSVSSHTLADAAEAFIVYAWLHECISLEESVTILEENDDIAEGFSKLLEKTVKRIKLS
jgi:hypothetical protein